METLFSTLSLCCQLDLSQTVSSNADRDDESAS
jgi:hypothetical protein